MNEQIELNIHFYHANVDRFPLNGNWETAKLRFLLQPVENLTVTIQDQRAKKVKKKLFF